MTKLNSITRMDLHHEMAIGRFVNNKTARILLARGGTFLLLQKTDGTWDAPTAHKLESGKNGLSLAQGLTKEIYRILDVVVQAFPEYMVLQNQLFDMDAKWIYQCFAAERWQGEITLRSPGEYPRMQWFKPQEAPTTINEELKVALSLVVRGEQSSCKEDGVWYSREEFLKLP